MPDDKKAMYDDAKLGMRMELFLKSEVGKYLIARAEMEEAAAIADLVALESVDLTGNVKARNNIAVVRMVGTWIQDAVIAGLSAKDNLQAMDDTGAGD